MFSKNFFIFINVLFLIFFNLFAQSLDSLAPDIEDTLVFGGEEDDFGYAIEQVAGGYIICGSTESFGSGGKDVYLIRTNGFDSELSLDSTFGGSQNDCGYSLQITEDGGYIICGYTESYGSGGSDIYLIRTDSLFDFIWAETFGGSEDDCGYSVEVTDDGGFIICGYTESFGAGGRDVYLLKTNSSGDSLWAKTFGSVGRDVGYSVKQTEDKGFIITGEKYVGEGVGPDIYLIKTDSLGDSVRACSYGHGICYDLGCSVIEASDGGFVVAGAMEPVPAMAQAYLLKTNFLGDSLWDCDCNGGGGYLNSVIETKENYYVATGVVYMAPGSFFLVKVDSSGDLLWHNYIGDEYDAAEGKSIRQTPDGGYIAVGTCENFGSSTDIWVVKIAPDEAGILEKKQESKDIHISCNPIVFSNITEIVYSTKSNNANVEIAIFDVNGERLKTIFRGARAEGQYMTSWDGTSDDGHLLPNGVYFLRVVSENNSYGIRKLVLLR